MKDDQLTRKGSKVAIGSSNFMFNPDKADINPRMQAWVQFYCLLRDGPLTRQQYLNAVKLVAHDEDANDRKKQTLQSLYRISHPIDLVRIIRGKQGKGKGLSGLFGSKDKTRGMVIVGRGKGNHLPNDIDLTQEIMNFVNDYRNAAGSYPVNPDSSAFKAGFTENVSRNQITLYANRHNGTSMFGTLDGVMLYNNGFPEHKVSTRGSTLVVERSKVRAKNGFNSLKGDKPRLLIDDSQGKCLSVVSFGWPLAGLSGDKHVPVYGHSLLMVLRNYEPSY